MNSLNIIHPVNFKYSPRVPSGVNQTRRLRGSDKVVVRAACSKIKKPEATLPRDPLRGIALGRGRESLKTRLSEQQRPRLSVTSCPGNSRFRGETGQSWPDGRIGDASVYCWSKRSKRESWNVLGRGLFFLGIWTGAQLSSTSRKR